MTEWQPTYLRELITIKNGKDHKALHDGEYPVYGSGGIMRYVDKYLYDKESVLLPRKGTLNNIQYANTPFWTVDTCYYTEVNTERVLPYFLYNCLRQYDIEALNTGSAIPSMTFEKYYSIQINLPNLDTQRRIAEVLSRYDALIENYQRQIKLLEEAAQRLYKEWFVDLRFPGHQSTPIINGIPKGWEKKNVDFIYSIKYGKNLSTKLISETGQFPVYGANGVIGYYKEANCNEQVVLITSRGNGSGDVLMTYHSDAFITNNSFIVTPNAEFSYCKLPFTFQFLRNANFRAVRTGAAQPQLTNQSIHTVVVTLPTRELITDYCRLTCNGNSMIIKLRNQIRNLSEARDRLLPKLMSGEIEV